MKGKGKGDRSNKTSDDCPLTFPNLKPVDHTRTCPRYTSVLSRDESDCVGLEEVDCLQTEFENLLASVAKRLRLLQNEIQILNNWQEKGKDRPGGSTPSHQSTPSLTSAPSSSTTPSSHNEPSTGGSTKRAGKGKTAEEKPAKRMRTDCGRATYAQPTSKSKGKVQGKPPESDATETSKPVDFARVPKNVTPNRFWAMVEPYCAEITTDDMKFLDEQIKICEDIDDYMKIPSLGKHYSDKWAEEDLLSEQREGSKVGERRKSLTVSNGTADGSAFLKKHEDGSDDESSPFGLLTQRLVQGLLEENIIAPLDDVTMISESDAMEAAAISPRSLAKQLHLGNTSLLEKRIRKELEEVGILGSDDERSEESADDEILAELRKKQAELKALSHQNAVMLRFLHKQAKEEIAQQELRKKLAAVDAEVIDAYRRVQASKGKKKTPTKKEKELFYKALRERQAIVKQLQQSSSQKPVLL